MERDFLGLAVKQEEEVSDEAIDAAPLRSSTMQWPIPNNNCGVPQVISSYNGAQHDRPMTGFDSLASTGLVTITTTENFDAAAMQKTNFPENQGGLRYRRTSYPTKHLDAYAIHPTSLTAPSHMPPSAHHLFMSQSGQNLMAPISPQPISAVPMPNPVPSSSSVVGTTDLRNTPKNSGAPAQLTIFYNGSVSVYDNISAEKAQAIMVLAGNGNPTTTPTAKIPAAPVQVPVLNKPSILESFVVNRPYGNNAPRRSSPVTSNSASPPLGWSSPVISNSASQPLGWSSPVTSNSASQPLSWSAAIKATTAPKQGGGVLVSSRKIEPQKVVNVPRSVPATFLPSSPSTVPQFRKKSLARFLEKRKERVISTTPYSNSESPDCSSSGGQQFIELSC